MNIEGRIDDVRFLPKSENSPKELTTWIFLSLLIIGASLRLLNLGKESIWWDEGFSIWVAKMGLLGMLKTVAAVDFNPPLYYLLLHVWMRLFGGSETAVRSLSALFGILSIAAIYFLAERIFNKKTGLIAALFLSISEFQVYYSQEARGFTLMLFLTILSFYYFIGLLRARNFASSVGYVASSVLLLYTHLFGLVMIAAQWVYLISLSFLPKYRTSAEFRRWMLTVWPIHQLALLALAAPWLYLLAEKAISLGAGIERAGAWSIERPSSIAPVATLALFAGSGSSLALYVGSLVYSLWRRLCRERNRRPDSAGLSRISEPEDRKSLLLLEWLLIPIASAFIFSLIAPSIYKPKYLIGASPALYLLVARAIAGIEDRKVSASLIVLAMALSLPGTWAHYELLHKEPWRRVAADIEANAKPGDLVLFYPGNAQKLAFDYYARRTDLVKEPFPKNGSFVNERNVRELEPLAKKYARMWVVEYHPDDKGLIEATLKRSHRLAGKGDYPSIKVYFFEKRQ